MSEQTTNNGQSQAVDLDLSLAVERVDSWLDGFVKLLPNLAVALVLMLVFYGLARLAAHLVRRSAASQERDNLGEVLGGFFKWAVLVLGFLLCATIVVPSLKPADLIAGLGVSSVAIGFAFKDILQNWLAGLLILIRQPFEIGDQIEIADYAGTVEKIETRATIIKTYDSQRVVVPNSDIYTSALKVKTAYEKRRSEYDVGIGYADDLNEAQDAIVKAIQSVDGVESSPAVQTLVWDLAASWVTVRVRWWTSNSSGDIVRAKSDVIAAIKVALDEQNIDMPYDTQVHLFHDQTEESDGDRATQREGWPTASQEGTKPRWRAEKEMQAES